MARMRKLWAEFKAIAIGGSVLDLALGFIIGTAFATVVQSFVTNIFLQVVALFIGTQDFNKLQLKIENTPIYYGKFLNDMLQFFLLAVALFIFVKAMTLVGIERGRPLHQRTCPFCLDRVPVGALTCKSCGHDLVANVPDLATAERMLTDREARRWPTLPPMPIRPRRRGAPAEPVPEYVPETDYLPTGDLVSDIQDPPSEPEE
jgi:large conductance mechanosensitive channel